MPDTCSAFSIAVSTFFGLRVFAATLGERQRDAIGYRRSDPATSLAKIAAEGEGAKNLEVLVRSRQDCPPISSFPKPLAVWGRPQAYTVDIRKQFRELIGQEGDSWARSDPFVGNS